MTEPKAKDAKAVITAIAKGSGNDSLATKRKNAAVVVLGTRNLATEKSFRNFGNFEVVMAKDVNPVELLTYKYVVIADAPASVEVFEKRTAVTAPKSK
jgi:ribosomal protein L4